jgi:hypothetical protein
LHQRVITAVIGLTAALLAITACDPTTTNSKDPGATGAGTGAASPLSTTAAAAAAPSSTAAATEEVPNLVGKGLQAAQDAAQASGFYNLASHDALGQTRHQILDRDWKVCSQSPAAGMKAATGTKLDFGAVKLAEACPKADVQPPAKTGKTMPNFVGKGLAAARGSLPGNASITSQDASGQDRIIILESNWKVCSQDPEAGVPFTGQPVTFTAVKTDEACA